MSEKLNLLRDFHKAGDPVPEEPRLPMSRPDALSIIKASVENLKSRVLQRKREQKEEQERSKTQEPSSGDDAAS